jgi:hypothetical protein
MSGWTGIDLGAYDLEEELRPTKTDAGQSALESFTVGDPNRRWKIREIAGFVGIGGRGPVVVGSPTQVARDETIMAGLLVPRAETPRPR